MANKTRVLILGGGFGGLYTALEFEKRRDLNALVTESIAPLDMPRLTARITLASRRCT